MTKKMEEPDDIYMSTTKSELLNSSSITIYEKMNYNNIPEKYK